ncbi:elongation factor 4 [Enterococcus silesiacus]|uniref:Elongation factor 4 n=1 Tax=Enterococcus silesiacus TaxID=332949 RepID=A0A0S3KCQ8_9ENTE|nr:translation elongation factor 4 [Enterococcus silesiacus]ALS02055.1 elongation factor 4 [Enterococcus silesiacus]OJG84900.1 GTP-binding protein LepA [Enterococcus silesiacus]
MKQEQIRNFSIIAHIDHGKSTLADRIMELTGTTNDREAKNQLLDDLAVEQSHGITVKSKTVQNLYKADNGNTYQYNLIDTPGHVDFSYEVSKSLAASEGALLLVDATQGIQAQTVANYRLAKQNHLTIIPVINKIDSTIADVPKVEQQIRNLDKEFTDMTILKISAKNGLGIHDVLEAIYQRIPAPCGEKQQPLKALIFDSLFDPFKGIIAYVRIYDGIITKHTTLMLMANEQHFSANELGVFTPSMVPVNELYPGEVGFIMTGLKEPHLVRIGDTLTNYSVPTNQPIQGYEPVQSMVFAGFYPKNNDYNKLKLAIEKLALNDSSFQFNLETSTALGPGFRCGFLGILHLQIIRERLEKEYGLEVLTTSPNVTYQVHVKGQQQQDVLVVNNPVNFPYFSLIEDVEEPYVQAEITTPNDSLGAIMKLAEKHKGIFQTMKNEADLVTLIYNMPLSEIAYDFFSHLKSASHGYATMNTVFIGYQLADVVKVEIHINYAKVDALSFVLHREDAQIMTQALVHKLKVTVPKKLYPMPVQAIIEGKVIARIDIPPLRKNAAVNGEQRSISKKQALLRRQSANKRLEAHSDVTLTQEVFNSILELDV